MVESTEESINRKMRGLAAAMASICDKECDDKKSKTLDIASDVIHQMCFVGECPYYKFCQDVGEGPWELDNMLRNPEQLSKCIHNGFKHTELFTPADAVCNWCGEVTDKPEVKDDHDELGPYYFCKCGQKNFFQEG